MPTPFWSWQFKDPTGSGDLPQIWMAAPTLKSGFQVGEHKVFEYPQKLKWIVSFSAGLFSFVDHVSGLQRGEKFQYQRSFDVSANSVENIE